MLAKKSIHLFSRSIPEDNKCKKNRKWGGDEALYNDNVLEELTALCCLDHRYPQHGQSTEHHDV